MRRRIIISGASGFIGRNLVRALQRKGYEIAAFTSNPKLVHGNNQYNITSFYFSKDNYKELQEIVDNSFGVINLSGAPIAGRRWNRKNKEVIYRSRIDSTNLIADLIINSTNTPKAFISISAVGFYGVEVSGIIDESFPPGNDFLAKTCDEWEKAALQVSEKTRVVIPRLGVVLGRDGGAFPRLIMPFRFFLGGSLGSGQQIISWIHVDDVVNGFIWALETGGASGVYNFVAPNPVKQCNFAKLTGSVIGKPSFFSTPGFFIKLLFGESSNIILMGNNIKPARLLEQKYIFKFTDLDAALSDLTERKITK